MTDSQKAAQEAATDYARKTELHLPGVHHLVMIAENGERQIGFLAGRRWTLEHDPAVLALVKALKYYAGLHKFCERIDKPPQPGGCPIYVDDLGPDPLGEVARISLANFRKEIEGK